MNVNNKETERKFLIKSLPEGLEKAEKHGLKQAYIFTDPTIRIRQWDNEFIFTFKGRGFIERTEFEHPLTEEQFCRLMKKAEGRIIEKDRYILPLDGELKAELDIYKGELKGFMNVEVEFESIEQAREFAPPAWFGREVTLDRRYSNGSIAMNGLPKE